MVDSQPGGGIACSASLYATQIQPRPVRLGELLVRAVGPQLRGVPPTPAGEGLLPAAATSEAGDPTADGAHRAAVILTLLCHTQATMHRGNEAAQS